jgi:putative NADPH-quinone reductase
MKTLIILAHPSPTSFSRAIAERFEISAVSAGKEVQMLDLYNSNVQQEFFEFQDIKNLPSDPQR